MNSEKSPVFEETYKGYLGKISKIDYLSKNESLGTRIEDNSLLIPLFDTIYRFGEDGISCSEPGALNAATQVMICKYILDCPVTLPAHLDDQLVTYREFKDSGPLISYFTTNTNKTLESTFRGDVDSLRQKGISMGGAVMDSDTYDLSLQFFAFPRIPVIVNFNDVDELFPAVCSVLYRKSAALFLDMECLSMTGTLLTGKLIGR